MTTGKFLLIGSMLVAGCATAPRSRSARVELQDRAAGTVEAILEKDPSVQPLLDNSAGYIVFPEVAEGGFIVGGGGAQGVIYQGGQPIAFAQLSRISFGAEVGGQKYAELIVVRDQFMLDKIKSGSVNIGGEASAVIIHAGAATEARWGENGVAVVVDPLGGAMLNLSVAGQQIKTTRRM